MDSSTLSGRCTTKVHMTSSIAVIRLGVRPHRQADCRSSRTLATGSPGHTLCCKITRVHKIQYLLSKSGVSSKERMGPNIPHLRLSSQVLDPVEDQRFGLQQILLIIQLRPFALIHLRPAICLHGPPLHTLTETSFLTQFSVCSRNK